MNHVLVTGATGFVGTALMEHMCRSGLPARSAGRSDPGFADHIAIPSIDGATDWARALADVAVVVHCAARVHVMDESAADPLAEFRRVNVEGTRALARQAAAAGVRRFIFLSSIKVNGEVTQGRPFTPLDQPAPDDPYGVSKLEAEEALRQISAETGMEIVIIRPVLVYGPGVKGNFRSMLSWLAKGMPLPLGAIHNQRSLVSLDNLVSLIVTCLEHPAAANQVFLASDGEDLSTTELLRRLARAIGRPARLLPVPPWALELAAAAVGKRDVARRLCGSLQVDITHTCETLGWRPIQTVDEALRKTVGG